MAYPDTICGQPSSLWAGRFPLLSRVAAGLPAFWMNPRRLPAAQALAGQPFSRDRTTEAADRLERFRPFFARAFPETAALDGRIESELRPVPAMRQRLAQDCCAVPQGGLLLKMDSHLPVSGSIKARGGIYEVVAHAERLALTHGLLEREACRSVLAGPEARAFFNGFSLAVGSTGNLGLSIGIAGTALGFRTTVHMSADARTWKKQRLRSLGVQVVEYQADYEAAVRQGREAAAADPRCHFVDDEHSPDLFLGYAVAGRRLRAQLEAMDIPVTPERPLYVYLPCGVGGGPGGVCLGLKQEFGDNVHCFFAEPAAAPAVLLGLGTGLHERICAADVGLDGRTAADGLAVSRPSGLVCRAVRSLVDGVFTVTDDTLYRLLLLLFMSEGIRLEPSAVAGFPGIARVLRHGGRRAQQGTHIVWATGGSLVPPEEWENYLRLARARF